MGKESTRKVTTFYNALKRRQGSSPMTACLLAALFLSVFVWIEASETSYVDTIEGTVWYRERMLLPPEAEVRVTLEDVSRMDVKSELISETRFKPHDSPPFSFTLSYDPAKIQANHRYALRARIEVNHKLMFISTEHIPAFDRDPDEPLNILVSRVAGTPP